MTDYFVSGRFSVRAVQLAGAILAGLVAAIHLLHPTLGGPRLVDHVRVGVLFDPRPLLFTVSAFLIICGILLVYNGVLVRAVYGFGIVLVALLLVGYPVWHTVLGHGAVWPYIEGHGHTDTELIEVVTIHLLNDPVALTSKLLESGLLVVLWALFVGDESGDD